MLRRLARVSDADGFIRTAAIDHPENYRILFDPDLSKVSFEEVVESKLELITAMSAHASSLLLDPVTSLGQAIITGAAPGDVGILSGVEDLYYTPDDSPVGFATELKIKPGWRPAQLAALGVDAAKLVVFYRADVEGAAAEHAHAVVAEVAAECHALHLPLVVEPLWYPLPGESPDDPAVRARRTESVIASAASFRQAGADIMKVEFPVSLATEDGRESADAACAALAEGIDGPWVLLSAGVTFDGFAEQMTYGARHGASGFMAGRAIWGDGVGRHDADRRAAGAAVACERLDRLTEILHAEGARRAWVPVAADRAAAEVPEDWYLGLSQGE